MCMLCKCDTVKQSTTTHVVNYKGSVIVIKNVPCEECEQCGEIFYADEVAERLEKIVDSEKELLKIRYGEDLEHLVRKPLTKEQTNAFYNILLPKIRKNLKELELTERYKIKYNEEINEKNEPLSKLKTNLNECEIIEEISKSLLFNEIIKSLTPLENSIISLKLSDINGKTFSNDYIAIIVGVDEIKVSQTIKKVLLLYKQQINYFIDDIIDLTTTSQEEISLKLKKSNE